MGQRADQSLPGRAADGGGLLAPELPDEVRSVEEAERYASEFARERQMRVCLVLSRRVSVWFDEQGSFQFATEAVPGGEPNEPYMKIGGGGAGRGSWIAAWHCRKSNGSSDRSQGKESDMKIEWNVRTVLGCVEAVAGSPNYAISASPARSSG